MRLTKKSFTKLSMVGVLTFTILSLVACNSTETNQDSPTPPTAPEQDRGEAPAGNANTNVIPNINEQSQPQEQLVGAIQVIEGMNITIGTSQHQVMTSDGQGTTQHFSSDSTANEPQEIIIRMTEQTVIEVNEISGVRAGALDDLTLQAFVMVEGEWQDDEFVATSLFIVAQ